MENNHRIRKILKILETHYPDVKTQLNYRTPFELLVATMLSAQCTDKRVNEVTRTLFQHAATPSDFVRIPAKNLEKLIYSTGFYKNKAKNIKACADRLLSLHQGEVPKEIKALTDLPGVGRKTANVVLGAAFGLPTIVVDTHVIRISRRLSLTENKDPVKIEFDLMALLPKKFWNSLNLRLIYFGRSICKARKPDCSGCPILKYCPFPDKTIQA